MVVAHNLKPLDLPLVVEGPLLVLATYALCFLGFEIVRRVWLLRPVFGLKAVNTDTTTPHNASNNGVMPAS